jgi:hypothetical protein
MSVQSKLPTYCRYCAIGVGPVELIDFYKLAFKNQLLSLARLYCTPIYLAGS